MQIGDYARTINGKIWIIKSQKAISGHKKDIIKYSDELIDLVESGDYVNGRKVIGKFDYLLELDGGKDGVIFIKNEEIRSIVTKEMFESVEYRIDMNTKFEDMKARYMFEKLGYELDNETIWYPKEYKHICYINGKDVILFTIGKTISFKKYFNDMLNEKDCNDYACNITYEELQAINKQVEELGWNK